jgi:colicin import membrane protein
MQTANVIVVVDPNHKMPKRGVTPAEVLILMAMHRSGSNGSPIEQLVITPDEAEVVEEPAKPAQEEYFDQHKGKHVDAIPGTPAVTRARTNAEEIERLRRFYTGTVKVNDRNVPAFDAVFGTAARITLPETFEDIREELKNVQVSVMEKGERPTSNVQRPTSNKTEANNGPTLEEFVEAGYLASKYPEGYLAKASPGWTQELARRKEQAEAEALEQSEAKAKADADAKAKAEKEAKAKAKADDVAKSKAAK